MSICRENCCELRIYTAAYNLLSYTAGIIDQRGTNNKKKNWCI